jgi:uncharacterized delta-60 repeat protein
MSPKLRLLTSVAVIFVLTLSISAQQLDTTFGTSGGATFALPPYSTPIPGISSAKGIRGFVRPNGSLAILVRFRRTQAKGQDINTMILGNFNSSGTGVTWGPHHFVGIAIDGALSPDGRIAAIWNASGDMKVGLLDTAGALVSTGTFGTANDTDEAKNVAVQPDGKILLSGSSTPSGGSPMTVILRFNPDGTLDPTFGSAGTGIVTLFDNGVLSEKMVLRPDGKILLLGKYYDNPPLLNETVSMYFQLTAGGSPDLSFGENGLAYVVDSGKLTLADLEVRPDGKIYTLSSRESVPAGTINYTEREVVLTRQQIDGSLDSSFGENGRVIANTSPPSFGAISDEFEVSGGDRAGALLLEGSGNVVIAMSSSQVVANRWTAFFEYQGQLGRRSIILLRRYDANGEFLGQNFSGQTPVRDYVSPAFSPMTDIFAQENSILVFGSTNPRTFDYPYFANTDCAAGARFSSIFSVNDANNFFDYNLDGKADFPSYNPQPSGFTKWVFNRSNIVRTQPPPNPYQERIVEFGLSGDIPVPGDYDGDQVQDLAVFRPDSGDWFTRKIYLNSCAPMDCTEQVHFGSPGDIPATGDFDGDGESDRAVFRPSEGNWYILYSSGGWTGLHFGLNGDLPVTGDYDDDGRSDVAVIRRENGFMTWYVLQSSNNQFVGIQFGLITDKAVPADYDSDGRTDIAVWRPSEGNWYILSNYTVFSVGKWGQDGDIPEPADYDGDGKVDFAIFRPSEGTHYARGSRLGNMLSYHSGSAADIPLASAYVR